MKTNIAVIGVGHLGKEHARILSELEKANLSFVVDIDRDQAEKIGERYDVPYYENHREPNRSNLDGVVVSVPTESHFKIASSFLESGVSVLVEKPMTDSYEEARNLVDLASDANVLLQVGHVERFNPAVKELTERIDKPRFIECDRLSPFQFRSADIDVIHDVMIHDLDVVLSLVDGEVEEISSVATPVITPFADIANARLRFSSGCIVNISASRISLESIRKLRIFTEDSYYSLDYKEQELEVLKSTKRLKQLSMEDVEQFRKQESSGHIDTEEIFKNLLKMDQAVPEDQSNQEPLRLELEEFVDAIRTGRTPVASGEEGARTMKLARDVRDLAENRPR